MIDVQAKIREAYYTALNGQLTYDASPVPVVDDKLEDDQNDTLYVVMSTQTAVDDSPFGKFDHETTMLLDIVYCPQDTVSKDVVDNVAQQIFNIILPTPETHGLTATGVQITNVTVENDSYLSFVLSNSRSVMRRLIRFKQLIHEL